MSETTRRTLLTAPATAAFIDSLTPALAAGLEATPASPRGYVGTFRRLPTQDMEGWYNFLSGRFTWMSRTLDREADKRAREIFKTNGIAPDADIPLAQLVELLQADPVIALTGKTWFEGQHYKFSLTRNYFHQNADAYYAEMEANDKKGPGTLEMDPKMHIPDYCRHEIHTQLGGYVGDPFAGYIYRHSVSYFGDGRQDQDENHIGSVADIPVPKDGKVKRILDMGCGIGQLTTALKRRFPEAEVWGIDIGAPMIRYGHVRANQQNLDINFIQGLAEATKFPDNHFDIITSYLLMHEVTAEAARVQFTEAQRILRPGGVYFPIDMYTSGPPPKDPFGRFRLWWTVRYNNEVWQMEWAQLNAREAMRKTGLQVSDGPVVNSYNRRFPNFLGTKA
jgi:ubiquinone/menaquinone biosynthesis C-methylase UbiE